MAALGLDRTDELLIYLSCSKGINDAAVATWRADNEAIIKATAEHFGISTTSVKRACQPVKV
jgi:hypothetical protein